MVVTRRSSPALGRIPTCKIEVDWGGRHPRFWNESIENELTQAWVCYICVYIPLHTATWPVLWWAPCWNRATQPRGYRVGCWIHVPEFRILGDRIPKFDCHSNIKFWNSEISKFWNSNSKIWNFKTTETRKTAGKAQLYHFPETHFGSPIKIWKFRISKMKIWNWLRISMHWGGQYKDQQAS